MSSKTRRQTIIDTVDTIAAKFLYYDRKESSTLPLGSIEASIAAGEITLDEIVAHFRTTLVQKGGLK